MNMFQKPSKIRSVFAEPIKTPDTRFACFTEGLGNETRSTEHCNINNNFRVCSIDPIPSIPE